MHSGRERKYKTPLAISSTKNMNIKKIYYRKNLVNQNPRPLYICSNKLIKLNPSLPSRNPTIMDQDATIKNVNNHDAFFATKKFQIKSRI